MYKCIECKNYNKSIYMDLGEEVLYSCWCKFRDITSSEECSNFEEVSK